MNDALKNLVEASRDSRMSNSEREAQRRSFAYGNTHFENPLITREMVDAAAEALAAASAKLGAHERDM
jgi:hypothetical protein